MITVRATREGLLGGKTSSGYIIDATVPFVALPSVKALGMFVRVVNPLNGALTYAVVLDVGPWNEHDDAYVFQYATIPPPGTLPVPPPPPVRPAAERGTDTRGRPTNGAGIDLSEQVWHRLGMVDNTNVSWEFLA
jgi:hypothetical protein